MSLSAICPHCQTSYKLADTLQGKTVRCKKCQEDFLVEAASVSTAIEKESPAQNGGCKPSKSDSPQRAGTTRRRRVEMDDEEEAERSASSARSSSKTLVLLLLCLGGGAVVLSLCAGGIGIAAWWTLRTPAATTVSASSNSNSPLLMNDNYNSRPATSRFPVLT